MPDLPDQFDLTGRVALVTGGAGLLGIEFSQALAQAGAQVVIADVNGEAALVAAASLDERWPLSAAGSGEQKRRGLGLATDVTSPTSVRQLVAAILDNFGRLDILVNSAALDPKFDAKARGIGEEVPYSHSPTPLSPNSLSFEDYPLDLWQQALDVNLTGMFLCCQAAVRPMLAQGQGVIVNLCSIYGLAGPDQRIYQREGQAPQYKPAYYSVTKAGVLGLTRYLAAYYAGKNIRVNALTPGGVYNGHDEEFVRAYSARAMLGRMAQKDELNGALLFLASDASAYMTGANLIVDGGWTAW
jgi:2-deoxy-D-gluconate 3-dehydrogenase